MAASDTRGSTMLEEATAQIVSQKLEILLSHPVRVECSLIQTHVRDAKAKLARIQEFLSTQYRPYNATGWSRRLLQAMYYAEQFIDKFHLREARKRHKALHMAAWPLTTLVSEYKLWRDLSILVNKMEELCNDQFLKEEAEGKSKRKPASFSSHTSVLWQGKKLARLTSFWDRQAPTKFSPHEAEKKGIMKQMKTSSYTQINIWGAQGTGKTFLARWAYGQAKHMGYEWRAWVHVSHSMDEWEFLLELLKQLQNLAGDVEEDVNIEETRTKLFKKLAETKKFLIVLDEVQPSNWRQLLPGLWRSTPPWSQYDVITTTQNDAIARDMSNLANAIAGNRSNFRMPIKLKNLEKGERRRMLAWKLQRVPNGQRLSNEKDILNICGDLPLSISLLGGFLSNTGEHGCAALAKEGSKMTLLDMLQLSCHKLPVHLKLCFIYMALFPIGFPIPTRRLVRLWLAEGLLGSHYYGIEKERKRQPEDVGETFILELADRNVIDVVSWRADGSPKACQILTSLYDVIRPIAASTGFLHIHATSKSKYQNDPDPTSQPEQLPAQQPERTKIRWLAEHTNIFTDDCGGNCPNLNLGHLRSFISFNWRRGMLTKDISTFLRKITSETDHSLLSVLDLEGVCKPSLHGVLPKLVLLRYLGLRFTGLDSIPSAVADLHHLETLDIKHTNITSLPSSLWKARNLRHLHLNWFDIDLKKILKACGDNVMALTQLQTLSGVVIGQAKENPMTAHMNSLTTLTTLKLFLQRSSGDTPGAAGEAVADWISFRLTNLQSLTFGVIKKAKPTGEALTAKEAKAAVEAEKDDKPMKKAKPATLQIGPLPELSLAEEHHKLLELYLLGQLNKPIWTQLLPVLLRVLTLSGSRVEADMVPELGGLLRQLRTFRLLANSFLGTSMKFAKDGFPSLKILKIWKLPRLQEVIIEEGAMLHLKELEFRHLDAMRTVTGIKECKELENIYVVVKGGAHDFVGDLNNGEGEMPNLYRIEETETYESTDDDDSP